MRARHLVLAISLLLSAALYSESAVTGNNRVGIESQADTMDQEIDKLINQRNLYLAKATRLQNQGDRLQFESNNLIDARRAWQQAQINREIATRIQEEIDTLENQRESFFKKHGMNYSPRDKND